MPVSIFLANTDGSLRAGNKAILPDQWCNLSTWYTNSVCVIDNYNDCQPLVIALEKPAGVSNFGKLTDVFLILIVYIRISSKRIDVVFVRYNETAIKPGTRYRGLKHAHSVRRMIENGSVPILTKFSDFLVNSGDGKRFGLFFFLIIWSTMLLQTKYLWFPVVFTRRMTSMVICLLEDYGQTTKRRTLTLPFTVFILISAHDADVLVLLVALFHKTRCTTL